MQDKSTRYHKHFYLTGPSPTHKLSVPPHLDRIGNPQEKSDLVTLTSLDTLSNTTP